MVLTAAHVVAWGVVLTICFALLFKWLPNIRLTWRDVLAGALVTTVLFSIGRLLIGFTCTYRQPVDARRRGGVDHPAAMVLLLGAGIPAGRGIHRRLCPSPGFAGRIADGNPCIRRDVGRKPTRGGDRA